MTRPYGIWCEVSGGVTGARAAWLKGGDGKVAMFADLAQAEAEADRLNEARAEHPTASFSYSARRFPVLGRRAKGADHGR